MTRAREAREIVRTHRSGVLSTQSSKLPGYPYGSALPHVTDHLGRPVILISHLAEHTHNIEADARVSFIVHATGANLQSQPRTTVVGEARVIPDTEAIEQRYLRYYPDHAQYLQIGGFRFYAVEPVQVRFIQGFGGLHWSSGEHYLAPADLAQAEISILEHMNRAYCSHVHSIDALDAQMIGVDCDGFDVRADGQILRFTFPELVTNSGQVRNALIDLADQARK
jgi:putative heme iron utilization protein